MAKDYLFKLSQNIIFYRNKLRLLNRAGIALLFIIIALLCYSVYRITSVPETVYFATTSDGRLIELNPM